jgi:hypothetical protein
MARPEVPKCTECEYCTMKPAKGGGFVRKCTGTTEGPPAPITNEARRHTSPEWCPRRHNYSLFTFRYNAQPELKEQWEV